eukprot:CAMPEP_0206000056 /NCGR_PEP_ID=MMETSP1464-20131121/1227_1 /ASSEMBLY_ACC=CAM_ASM_001124 /TAXON_ID=119497 /ORGANISM="Exanthemachrysis gayraliae, Strain RCC1523" /LENGTH=383 /DNA_ID=CAMNT_0053373293 /DNA_START=89 /DNA_END=1239 /DNA_ORIENTATION=+
MTRSRDVAHAADAPSHAIGGAPAPAPHALLATVAHRTPPPTADAPGPARSLRVGVAVRIRVLEHPLVDAPHLEGRHSEAPHLVVVGGARGGLGRVVVHPDEEGPAAEGRGPEGGARARAAHLEVLVQMEAVGRAPAADREEALVRGDEEVVRVTPAIGGHAHRGRVRAVQEGRQLEPHRLEQEALPRPVEHRRLAELVARGGPLELAGDVRAEERALRVADEHEQGPALRAGGVQAPQGVAVRGRGVEESPSLLPVAHGDPPHELLEDALGEEQDGAVGEHALGRLLWEVEVREVQRGGNGLLLEVHHRVAGLLLCGAAVRTPVDLPATAAAAIAPRGTTVKGMAAGACPSRRARREGAPYRGRVVRLALTARAAAAMRLIFD